VKAATFGQLQTLPLELTSCTLLFPSVAVTLLELGSASGVKATTAWTVTPHPLAVFVEKYWSGAHWPFVASVTPSPVAAEPTILGG